MRNSTVIQCRALFERLAADLWADLETAEKYNIPQGEEGITNELLRKIASANMWNIRLLTFNKSKEGDTGIDWVWWIGSEGIGWWKYAIQAKHLDRTGHYKHLWHEVKGSKRLQIDLLDSYSMHQDTRSIPLYCFYNFLPKLLYDIDHSKYWHCTWEGFQPEQLGCTLVPLEAVRKVKHRKGETTAFGAIHEDPDALPWRCLFHLYPDTWPIDAARPETEQYTHPYMDPSAYYPTLLPILASVQPGTSGQVVPPSLRNHETGVYPKRMMIIDLQSG